MRYIGIRHRVKKTADDEARPTQVYILEEDLILELEDDNAELDWVRGTFPVSFRPVGPDEERTAFNPRHIQWRTVRKTEDIAKLNPAHLREVEGKTQIVTKVPDAYDGLRAGDVYTLSLGGSGDRLAFALSKVGERVNATVLRIPPSILKERRGDNSKDEDPKLLANLGKNEPNLFHEVTANTRAITTGFVHQEGMFNLAGEGSAYGAMGTVLPIPADGYTPVDAELIPSGAITSVAGTAFDFRVPTAVGTRIRDASDPQLVIGRGYDHNYVLNGKSGGAPRLAARLADPKSSRVLEIFSDQPGIQFYAGNFIDGTMVGKSGKIYRQGDGIALEPQHFPDAPNKPGFASTRLDPGQTYSNTMVFRLSTAR